MRIHDRSNRTRGSLRRAGMALGLIAAMAGLTACEGILDVELPGKVPAGTLDDPGLAATLVDGAVADFECAYNNYTFAASNHSDETWHSSGNLIMRRWGQRRITPDFGNYVTGTCEGWGYGLWVPIHTARFQAEDALQRLEGFSDAEVPEKATLRATAAAYAGYGYTLLGEGFCRMTVDGGSPMEPEAVLDIAEDRFSTAITLAESAGEDEILNMARVGRARVRLDLGRPAEAAADARLVPEGFVKMATRSAEVERRWNKGKRWYDDGGHATIAPAFRSLEWKGVPDPRVEVVDAGRVGFDGVTDLWVATKYASVASDIPLATWEEAQLIIAEAEGGQTAVGVINDLHERAGLPEYDPSTDGPIRDHIIQERSRELFLEGGHRLNDMLRYDLPFSEGVDHVGQQYGSTTCFPLPTVEQA